MDSTTLLLFNALLFVRIVSDAQVALSLAQFVIKQLMLIVLVLIISKGEYRCYQQLMRQLKS